jgi:hypothetical protein
MTGGLPGEQFPTLVFGAANALFLLMALFMLADMGRYGAYASLYAAGKILGVLVLISCGIFWQDVIIQAIMIRGVSMVYILGCLLGITMGDLLSAGGGILLARSSKQGETDTDMGNGSV